MLLLFLQLTFSITRHQEPLCTQTMLFPRQGQLVTIQDDHMLYLKWNTARHPKLNVNIAIRLLHCVCYHMIQDRTSTEEMLFRLKRQTVVLVKTLPISPLLSNIIFVLSEIRKVMDFFCLWVVGGKKQPTKHNPV